MLLTTTDVLLKCGRMKYDAPGSAVEWKMTSYHGSAVEDVKV